ncbi:MAG TPA: hypothetical protein VM425_03775 [Myxococcota bacterium]|nr:hypothetical protein [Myxococcota bacterium]
MTRSLKDCPKAPSNADPWARYEKLDLTVRVVTPMFGGGVEEAGKEAVLVLFADSASAFSNDHTPKARRTEGRGKNKRDIVTPTGPASSRNG